MPPLMRRRLCHQCLRCRVAAAQSNACHRNMISAAAAGLLHFVAAPPWPSSSFAIAVLAPRRRPPPRATPAITWRRPMANKLHRCGHPSPRPADGPKESSSQQMRRARWKTREANAVPDIEVCKTIEEATQMARSHLRALSPKHVSDFWSHLYRLMRGKYKSKHLYDKSDRRQMIASLRKLVERTQGHVEAFSPEELAKLALALAKIISDENIRHNGRRRDKGRVGALVRNVVTGQDSIQKFATFDLVARAVLPLLSKFSAGELSDLARAFGLINYAPRGQDGRTILDYIAEEAIPRLKGFVSLEQEERIFEPQQIADLLWSYAITKRSHALLFEKVGNAVIEYYDLQWFKPEELSSMLLAYSEVGEFHPSLFGKILEEVVATGKLEGFDPQSLADLACAYAETEGSYPHVFKAVTDAMVRRDDLDEFPPHVFASILMATVSDGVPRPRLFEKVADAIISTFLVEKWRAPEISVVMRAYASSGMIKGALFERMADAANERRKHLVPRELAGVLWAYAHVGQTREHEQLFAQLAPRARQLLSLYTCQELVEIAWAYAVADVDAPEVFNEKFVEACIKEEENFTEVQLCRLHQWQLWQEEMSSEVHLPAPLQERCHVAFTSSEFSPESRQPSELIGDVVLELSYMGFQPEEVVRTPRGYHLDVTVIVDRKKVGVMLDGPSRFAFNGDPTGETVLSRRQVAGLEDISVISLPYWEWEAFGEESDRKRLYLRLVMGLGAEVEGEEVNPGEGE